MQSRSKAVGRLSEQRLGLQSVVPALGAQSGPQRFDLTDSLAGKYEPLRKDREDRRNRRYRRERYGFGQIRRHESQKVFHTDDEGYEYSAQAWLGPEAYRWLRQMKGGPGH